MNEINFWTDLILPVVSALITHLIIWVLSRGGKKEASPRRILRQPEITKTVVLSRTEESQTLVPHLLSTMDTAMRFLDIFIISPIRGVIMGFRIMLYLLFLLLIVTHVDTLIIAIISYVVFNIAYIYLFRKINISDWITTAINKNLNIALNIAFWSEIEMAYGRASNVDVSGTKTEIFKVIKRDDIEAVADLNDNAIDAAVYWTKHQNFK